LKKNKDDHKALLTHTIMAVKKKHINVIERLKRIAEIMYVDSIW